MLCLLIVTVSSLTIIGCVYYARIFNTFKKMPNIGQVETL